MYAVMGWNTVTLDPDRVMCFWYNEMKDYNFQQNDFMEQAGHFTQIVWKSTKKLGVGYTVGQ